MRIIAKYKGGSHSYGLNTLDSDEDIRGIFLNTEIKDIIGLGRHEHQQSQSKEQDVSYTEFRNALKLLRGGNTQMVEAVYNEHWLELSSEWKLVINNRQNLVNSEKLFSVLRGYMQGELRLANGDRKGEEGGKRNEAIKKYGFSPKNYCHYYRLSHCGQTYFEKGYFPVNIMEDDKSFGEFLLDLKVNPRFYNKDQLNKVAIVYENRLIRSYEERKYTTTFDEDLANALCLEIYGTLVHRHFYEKYGV